MSYLSSAMANVSLGAGYSGYSGPTMVSAGVDNGPTPSGQPGQVFNPLQYETTASVPDLWIAQKGVYGSGYGLQNGTPRATYQ
jgi:hypothetical protein